MRDRHHEISLLSFKGCGPKCFLCFFSLTKQTPLSSGPKAALSHCVRGKEREREKEKADAVGPAAECV